MRTTWLGLEIALRGLQAQQVAINTTGHNVANTNTPGFTRQGVRMVATEPLSNGSSRITAGMIGTGVEVNKIQRIRDEFLDYHYRLRSAANGEASQWVRVFDQLEDIFREPSDNGFRAQMDRFWDAMQSLFNDPSAPATRAEVVESARGLMDAIRDTAQRLEDLHAALNDELVTRINDINRMLVELAELNRDIAFAQARGEEANDLMDRRDLLADELARIAGARVYMSKNGMYAVSIGGRLVLQGELIQGFDLQDVDGDGDQDIVWVADNQPVTITGGELAAIQKARDETIPTYISYLETWTRALIDNFNAQHRAGYFKDAAGNPQTGQDFFSANAAATGLSYLKSVAVIAEPWQVAAAGDPNVYHDDASNVQELLKVLENPALVVHPDLSPGGTSLQGFYRTLIAELGVTARHARAMETTTEMQLDQANNQRLSVMGVNLDEEMTRLIQYQHAYGAAGRLMTAVDEMLDVLVNRVGLVGR
nr:MAG: flagellar hook-associated protein FlgK [Bacillota bacterium]